MDYDTCDGTGAGEAVRGTYEVPGFPAQRPAGTRAVTEMHTFHGPPGMADRGMQEYAHYLAPVQLAARLAWLEAYGYRCRVSWTVRDTESSSPLVASYDGKAGRRTR